MKKVEVEIMYKYRIENRTVFRGLVDKKIPYKGVVILNSEEITFFFHGSGITYEFQNFKVTYNFFRKGAFGISFTIPVILQFIAAKNIERQEFSEDDFIELSKIGVIKRVWKEYEVFCLNNNFDEK